MSLFHAIVLGLVQGLTEFLPISSSGHLILVPWLFGWNDFNDIEIQRAFDTALHLGTLVAVLFYLRSDLVPYVREGIKVVVAPNKANKTVGHRAWMFVLSAVPAGIAGALAESWITEKLGTPAQNNYHRRDDVFKDAAGYDHLRILPAVNKYPSLTLFIEPTRGALTES